MRLLDVYEGATGVLGFRAFGVRCFRFGESEGLGLFCSGLGGSNVKFRVSGFKASLGFEIVGNLGSGYLNPKHKILNPKDKILDTKPQTENARP